MNILKLLVNLTEADPELLARLGSRREALTRLGSLTGKAAVATAPLVLGSALRQAYGRGAQTITDSLSLALTLELLENNFYSRALGLVPNTPAVPAGFIPADLRPGIVTVQQHEQQHVAFLTRALQASGADITTNLNFDFTGSKNGTQSAPFADVFSNFDTFLQVAQLLEDTGVRAYKGQLATVQSDRVFLTAAARIHSVEARHAAHIRTLRRNRNATVKPWVSPTDQSITTAGLTDAVYAGEENTTQRVAGQTIPFDQLPIDAAGVGQTALQKVQAAFDEPMTATTASNLADLFIY
ncbi:ferritin-like domain-containing protein [Hymenobacter defluvii]|uniref:Ferritin-like domain-containing protein n=1 Tax=Hymenobacter defluvii TaxID=2054411 RepID=A0ABS3TGD3_9BACT|nr:ferritin-like domain-containing protein [Hymenobacter defluvii]MBO3272720.1 ferritin-like domain-containing protein [Hymenobacter defluvii]